MDTSTSTTSSTICDAGTGIAGQMEVVGTCKDEVRSSLMYWQAQPQALNRHDHHRHEQTRGGSSVAIAAELAVVADFSRDLDCLFSIEPMHQRAVASMLPKTATTMVGTTDCCRRSIDLEMMEHQRNGPGSSSIPAPQSTNADMRSSGGNFNNNSSNLASAILLSQHDLRALEPTPLREEEEGEQHSSTVSAPALHHHASSTTSLKRKLDHCNNNSNSSGNYNFYDDVIGGNTRNNGNNDDAEEEDGGGMMSRRASASVLGQWLDAELFRDDNTSAANSHRGALFVKQQQQQANRHLQQSHQRPTLSEEDQDPWSILEPRPIGASNETTSTTMTASAGPTNTNQQHHQLKVQSLTCLSNNINGNNDGDKMYAATTNTGRPVQRRRLSCPHTSAVTLQGAAAADNNNAAGDRGAGKLTSWQKNMLMASPSTTNNSCIEAWTSSASSSSSSNSSTSTSLAAASPLLAYLQRQNNKSGCAAAITEQPASVLSSGSPNGLTKALLLRAREQQQQQQQPASSSLKSSTSSTWSFQRMQKYIPPLPLTGGGTTKTKPATV